MDKLKKIKNIFSGHYEIVITLLIFIIVYGFLFLMLDTKLVLTDTHVTGGDTGSHIYIVNYLREIFPKIKWWSPDWYSGFPFFYFYPPLMYICTVLLGFVIPINIAFKMIIFSAVLILPLSFYFSLKWLGMKFPIPQLGALFSLFLIFLEKYTIYGGNLASLLAGEFSHTMSIALLFMFLGLMYKGMKADKHLIWNIILGASVMLIHPISGILLILLFPFLPFQEKQIKKNIRYVFLVYLGIFLLSAFWTLSLAGYKSYSGLMHWQQQIKLSDIFPGHWFFLNVAAGLGILYAIFKKERKLVGFFWLIWMALVIFLSLDKSSVWNCRFLPYISFGILFLAAYFGGTVLIAIKKRSPIIMAILLAVMTVFSVYTVKNNTSFVSSWFKWNFEGYEKKASWPEVDNLFSYLKTLPKGRVMWEYRPEYGKYGTTRFLETIPVFSNQPTFEGLLIESSIFGPFHFTNQTETTDKPTSAIAGFQYPPFNFDKGVKHLKMSGARYFIAYSDMVKSKANRNADLVKLKDEGSFSVFEIKDSKLVEPVKDFIMQEKNKDWTKKSFDWYKNANPDKPIVFVRNNEERLDLENIKSSSSIKIPENIKQTSDSIEFDVEKTNVPYLVKISYFPTWRVKGAKGPYLVSPSYMMVVPTEKHVKLYFSYGWIDWLGMFLSIVGIGYLFFVKRINNKLELVLKKVRILGQRVD